MKYGVEKCLKRCSKLNNCCILDVDQNFFFSMWLLKDDFLSITYRWWKQSVVVPICLNYKLASLKHATQCGPAVYLSMGNVWCSQEALQLKETKAHIGPVVIQIWLLSFMN